MKITVLGCGTSTGVPRVPGDWGACDPGQPRNRRRRPSILVEAAGTTLVVDTGPDFREQMLDAGVDRLDAVLYTHEHADHTHGIDDVRGFFMRQQARIPMYGDARTLQALRHRFGYVFVSRFGYPPTGDTRLVDGPFRVGDIQVTPFDQQHGLINSLGFRFGPFAYSTDVNGLSDEAFATLEGVDTWLVDAVRYRPHPSHAHLDMTLGWIERVRPRQAILTHMAQDMDYDSLVAQLPPGVEPGYDGQVLSFE